MSFAPSIAAAMGEITELLRHVNSGEPGARDRLYALLYDELRRLARSRLRDRGTITLLDTTALVHETYLRFLNARRIALADRGRFFAFAASIMRSIVIDAIRKRRAERRGGGAAHVEVDGQLADELPGDDTHVLRVHEALQELALMDPRLGQVVEMRYFSGLSEVDIASALGVSERTVRRDWDKARTLLFAALR